MSSLFSTLATETTIAPEPEEVELMLDTPFEDWPRYLSFVDGTCACLRRKNSTANQMKCPQCKKPVVTRGRESIWHLYCQGCCLEFDAPEKFGHDLRTCLKTSSASISADGKYRYCLSRITDARRPSLLVIGLNPSTADATNDDPTIRRCRDFANRWGFGRLFMLNLFAWRSPQPSEMKAVAEPVGPLNDAWLQAIADDASCTMILAAWGKDGNHLGRGQRVLEMLPQVHALKINKDGTPKHPLYIPARTRPFPFR